MTTLNNIKSILPNWLEKEAIVSNTAKGFLLDLPFLDINNDYVRLRLVSKDDGSVYITDDGDSYSTLWERTSGMKAPASSFFEESFKDLISALPKVEFNDKTKEIYSSCSINDELGLVIAMMIEGVIRCTSAVALASFRQDAKRKADNFKKSFELNYLAKFHCSYEHDPKVAGKELSEHTFDFLVNGRQGNYVKMLNDRESQTKKALLYDWKDVVGYENLPPLVAISKSGEPKNPKNKKEDESLSSIIRGSNIIVFSEADDAQRIENYFSSFKAS